MSSSSLTDLCDLYLELFSRHQQWMTQILSVKNIQNTNSSGVRSACFGYHFTECLYWPIVGSSIGYSFCTYISLHRSTNSSFNWRYVYTHLIFFKITSLSINTPLPAVLPRVVARLEVLNWDLFQSIRHGSLHVFNSPKMVSFQAGFETGKQKEIGRDSPDLGRTAGNGVLMLKDVILKNIKCV